MTNNKSIHPLASPNQLSGMIRFIHKKDGAEHTFKTCVNKLTNDRLSWFDNDAPEINTPISDIKKMFKNIREKSARVIESIGDF